MPLRWGEGEELSSQFHRVLPQKLQWVGERLHWQSWKALLEASRLTCRTPHRLLAKAWISANLQHSGGCLRGEDGTFTFQLPKPKDSLSVQSLGLGKQNQDGFDERLMPLGHREAAGAIIWSRAPNASRNDWVQSQSALVNFPYQISSIFILRKIEKEINADFQSSSISLWCLLLEQESWILPGRWGAPNHILTHFIGRDGPVSLAPQPSLSEECFWKLSITIVYNFYALKRAECV